MSNDTGSDVHVVLSQQPYEGAVIVGIFSLKPPADKFAELCGEDDHHVESYTIDKGIKLADGKEQCYAVRFNKAGDVTAVKVVSPRALREDFTDREDNRCVHVVAQNITLAVTLAHGRVGQESNADS